MSTFAAAARRMLDDIPDPPPLALWWTANTSNTKTGQMPTAFVRRDIARESCKGCPHEPRTCYAWRGQMSMGLASMERAHARNPHRYTLAAALAGRAWAARYARMTAIGDLTAAPPEELRAALQAIDEAGLGLLAYTSRWMHKAHDWLSPRVIASTITDGATRRAIERGWVVAQTIHADTFAESMDAGHYTTRDGFRLKLCDNMTATLNTERAPTCNDCGFCDARTIHASPFDGVAFPEHGPHQGGRVWTRLVQAARHALTTRSKPQ